MALSTFTVQREHDKFVENSDGDTAVRVVNDNLNEFGELPIVLGSHISTDNSTTTILDPAGTNVFTGTAEDITDASTIIVSLKASHASATDGLSVQFSPDGTNWDNTDDYTIPAAKGKTFSFQPAANYMRVVYTNGTTKQTYFRLQTIIKHTNVKASSHRIADAIIDDDDAELVTSVLKAKANGSGYVNIEATASNNLRVTDAESGLAIAKGEVVDTSFIHKFGAAPDFDIADGFVTVWDAAEDDEAWELMNYVYSTTAAIDKVASTAADTVDVEIQGLDANYDLVTQTITLTGTTPASLTTNLIRVFRIKNVGSTNLSGHVIVFEDDTTNDDAGVPDDSNLIRAVVHPDNNQTEMAVYTIPNGYTGYMRSWYASTAGAKRDSAHTIKILARPFGQVFQLKHKANIDVNGTSYIQHEYVEPEVFAAKTDIEMQMDTDTDIAGVAGGFDIVLIAD
jgi:hypothetical protein